MRKINLLFLLLTLFSCDKKEAKDEAIDLQTDVNQNDTLEVKSESTENRTLSTDWQDELIVD